MAVTFLFSLSGCPPTSMSAAPHVPPEQRPCDDDDAAPAPASLEVRRRKNRSTTGHGRRRSHHRHGGGTVLGGLLLLMLLVARRRGNDDLHGGSPWAVAVPTTCPLGFGGGSGTDGAPAQFVTIEPHMIDDNYCDCPTSGIDEPHTNACSGHVNWSGMGSFHLDDDDDQEPSRTYACPQQPNKLLSLSKLSDGICDCCCGSDEPAGECPDVCDQVLAEERKRRKELQANYQKGSTLRNQRLQEFQQKKDDVQRQLDEKQLEVANVQQETNKVQQLVQQAKLDVYASRRQRVQEVLMTTLAGMFEPLTTPELFNFVVHACQMAGEMVVSGDASKTCLPLRLAGLDLGIVWKHSTYQVSRRGTDANELAEMLHWNVHNPSQIVYNEHGLQKQSNNPTKKRIKNRPDPPRRRRHRRRDDYDEDEYLLGSGDDEDEDFDDEDDDVVATTTKPPAKSSSDDDEDTDETTDEARKEHKKNLKAESERFHAELRQRPLGLVQNAFLESSKAVLDRMNGILDDLKRQDEEEKKREREQRRKDMERRKRERAKKDTDSDSNDREDDEPEERMASSENELDKEEDAAAAVATTSSQAETLPENFDPVALPLARDALAGRQSQVQRGYQYAVSAKILLDALLESHAGGDIEDGTRQERIRHDLSMLAVGTLAHGRVSAVHAWQIYQGVVDGLMVDAASGASSEEGGADEQTCKSPWTALCPPRSIERTVHRGGEDAAVQIPPEVIRRAVAAFCDEQMALLASNAESCLSTAAAAAELPIPSSIPDGYLGYVPPKPRNDDDVLAVALAAVDLSYSDDAQKVLEGHVEREKQLESDQSRLQDDIRDLTDSIGYDDPSKYGEDGELYALKDECFSYDTGKYVYEICLFGGSKQKEGKNSGGTDLGSWTGTSVDDESGHRLWKWENGQRCWNGPNRSATARVTCGATTRVVSVDEPEMCKYVLEVESYVACDDAFAAAHGLESA